MPIVTNVVICIHSRARRHDISASREVTRRARAHVVGRFFLPTDTRVSATWIAQTPPLQRAYRYPATASERQARQRCSEQDVREVPGRVRGMHQCPVVAPP